MLLSVSAPLKEFPPTIVLIGLVYCIFGLRPVIEMRTDNIFIALLNAKLSPITKEMSSNARHT